MKIVVESDAGVRLYEQQIPRIEGAYMQQDSQLNVMEATPTWRTLLTSMQFSFYGQGLSSWLEQWEDELEEQRDE